MSLRLPVRFYAKKKGYESSTIDGEAEEVIERIEEREVKRDGDGPSNVSQEDIEKIERILEREKAKDEERISFKDQLKEMRHRAEQDQRARMTWQDWTREQVCTRYYNSLSLFLPFLEMQKPKALWIDAKIHRSFAAWSPFMTESERSLGADKSDAGRI